MSSKIDSESKKSQAMELRLSGLTYRAVAKKMGVSYQYVQQVTRPPRAVLNLVAANADQKCQDCGIILAKSGHVHHIQCVGKTADTYNDIGNLLYLCASCHRKAHKVGSGREIVVPFRPRKQDEKRLELLEKRFGVSKSEVVRMALKRLYESIPK